MSSQDSTYETEQEYAIRMVAGWRLEVILRSSLLLSPPIGGEDFDRRVDMLSYAVSRYNEWKEKVQ